MKGWNKHPLLKARIEGLLGVVENAAGTLEKADVVEQRVVQELRQMGSEVIHCWARNKERKKSDELKGSEQRVQHKGKKTLLIHVIRNDRS